MVDGQTKPLRFLGNSLQQIRDFPEDARKEAGVELHKIQQGLEPNDWKPMTSVGPGVREIRIRDEGGAFRVLYVANIESAIYVLHAFQEEDPANGQTRFGPGGTPPEGNLIGQEGGQDDGTPGICKRLGRADRQPRGVGEYDHAVGPHSSPCNRRSKAGR